MRSEQSSLYTNIVQNLTSLITWWEKDQNGVYQQLSHCLSTISKIKNTQVHLLEAEEILLNHVKTRVGETQFADLRLVRLSDNSSGEFKARV